MTSNWWYVATVVDINDPDKRRRIKARGPKETEDVLSTDALPWLQPVQLHQDDFSLPDVNSSILVLKFNSQCFWIDLPNKAAWQDFGDDYATAWLFTHKDVLKAVYLQSTGFEFDLTGDIVVKTDKTTCTIKADSIEFTFDKVKFSTDGKSAELTIDNVKCSTDGSKVSLSNAGVNLADVIANLEQALLSHTHTSSVGPTGTPINVQDFTKNNGDFKQLFQ